eukprot:COSAG06_NODE_16_length_34949_cov_31.500832_7_plen_74_part_00
MHLTWRNTGLAQLQHQRWVSRPATARPLRHPGLSPIVAIDKPTRGARVSQSDFLGSEMRRRRKASWEASRCKR